MAKHLSLLTDFCGPFDVDDATVGFASVLPGDEQLYVIDGTSGGGALNGAFGKALKGTGHDLAGYRPLHVRAALQAAHSPDALVELAMEDKQLKFVGARTFSGASGPFGSAFVDVFADKFRPAAEAVALVYCVGPLGIPGEASPTAARQAMVLTDKAKFLDYLHKTSENVLHAVNEYNEQLSVREGALPRIQTMRVPVIAGGTRKHPDATEAEVARALLDGLRVAWRTGSSPELSLAHLFADAVRDTKAEWDTL